MLKNKDESRDTFLVNKYTAPSLDSNRIYFHRFDRYINNRDINIAGYLYFNIKDSSLKCIINSSNQNDKINKLVTRALEVPKSYWNLTGFEGCKYVGIPFYLITSVSSHIKYYGNRHIIARGQEKRGTLYFIDTPHVASRIVLKNGDYYPNESLKEYKKGITAFETHDTAKALKYFKRAYDLNKNNINAGYNYAIILYQTGQKDEACKIMTELKDTDDKGCKEFYEKYCQ